MGLFVPAQPTIRVPFGEHPMTPYPSPQPVRPIPDAIDIVQSRIPPLDPVVGPVAETTQASAQVWRNALVWTKQILTHPRQMGAVVPSSGRLADAMVRAAGVSAQSCVIELGPGTGVITRALLRAGVNPQHIHALERDPGMARRLQQQHPKLDVRTVSLTDHKAVFQLGLTPERVIISSLPWRAFTAAESEDIARSVSGLLGPEGTLIQYTYGSVSPIPSSLTQNLRWEATPVEHIWRNLPPATVWRYERQGKMGERKA